VAIYQNVDFSAQLILRSFQQIKGTIAHPNLPVKNNTLHELIRFFGAKYHLYRVIPFLGIHWCLMLWSRVQE
jgi:hypothetical protein